MRILCTKQKTAEWLQCRVGKITASRADAVLNYLKQTKAEQEAGIRREGADRRNYRMELIAERLTLIPADHYVSKPMEFGAEYEDDARRAYELHAEVMVDQTGFVGHPRIHYAGSSPDGLVGDDGGLELKVPQTTTHLGYLFANEVPAEYKPQMFFNMACCERDWWDFASYDPRLPRQLRLFVRRLHWDEDAIDALEAEVMKFDAEIQATIKRLTEIAGDFKLPEFEQPEPQSSEGMITDEEIAAAIERDKTA